MSGAPPVLELDHLSVSYSDERGFQRVVHDVSFRVGAGEVVGLLGESGSGKTTIAQAVIGLLPSNGRLDGGAIRLHGTDIAGWSQRRLDAVRGARISLIPQDPSSSLNPVKTIGAQVAEILRVHRAESRHGVRARVVELLARVGLSRPELRAAQYPHELSGGMRQRVLIAIAIALKPALIIADEATSALDVTVQRRILDLIDGLRREYGAAILFVTHDLAVAADRASRVVVLRGGRIQEQGDTAQVLSAPTNAYTSQLLADAPSFAAAIRPAAPAGESGAPAVVVENLVQEFALGGRGGGLFRAVDGVSFTVRRGATHAIVGESGSGKTTIARALAGLSRPTAGRVLIGGADPTTMRGEALRQFRKQVQLVYRNPFGSLDPLHTVFRIVEEPLLNFEPIAREERARRVHDMLERVRLPRALALRRPRELSGGQRQRVAIARALTLGPPVLVLDEAVSALDVTVQAQILRLLQDLQAELRLSYVFVSHDLAVVRGIADTVSVLHSGRQVDGGLVEEVFNRPTDAYTRELIEAIPGRRHPARATPRLDAPAPGLMSVAGDKRVG